jgi:plastocyanin
MIAGCGDDRTPVAPTPPAPTVTANAYILPDAPTLGKFAFGDEPVVIYKGERLRWVNTDNQAHLVVADKPDATDFVKTGELARWR